MIWPLHFIFTSIRDMCECMQLWRHTLVNSSALVDLNDITLMKLRVSRHPCSHVSINLFWICSSQSKECNIFYQLPYRWSHPQSAIKCESRFRHVILKVHIQTVEVHDWFELAGHGNWRLICLINCVVREIGNFFTLSACMKVFSLILLRNPSTCK